MQTPATKRSIAHLKVDDFELAVVAGGLNAVVWRGVEVLRGVNCLLRDENWATFSPENVVMTMSADTEFPQRSFRQTYDLGGLAAVDLTVTVDAGGRFKLSTEITAKSS